jgi:two-component system, NarL family, response regulator LiaR
VLKSKNKRGGYFILSNETVNTISILLVDDHPLLRQAIKDVLLKEKDFSIIAEAADGGEAVKLALKLKPKVVIMDISMPKMNGLEATRHIKEKNPEITILALTVHTEDEYILDILQSGAGGYLIKNVFGDEVVQAVRAIAAGDMVLSPSIGQHLIKHAARHPTKPLMLEAGEKLTTREQEVLKLVAQGKSNKEIAKTLDLNLRTVKGHLTEIFSKLRVGSRTEAVITGLRAGFIAFDDIK